MQCLQWQDQILTFISSKYSMNNSKVWPEFSPNFQGLRCFARKKCTDWGGIKLLNILLPYQRTWSIRKGSRHECNPQCGPRTIYDKMYLTVIWGSEFFRISWISICNLSKNKSHKSDTYIYIPWVFPERIFCSSNFLTVFHISQQLLTVPYILD